MLEEHTAHIWRVALDSISPSVETRAACLSADERARSERFIAHPERRRFILSRIALRHILASYHGTTPRNIPLAREPGGRPYVEGAERLFFSLSHSGDIALIAVAATAVGVDVERERRILRAPAIARRVLHPETFAILSSLDHPRFEPAFLDAWTQREAHVKAVGGGLFRTADVLPFDPAQPADATVRAARSREDGSEWSIARFVPCPSARGAVVSPGILHHVRLLDWSDAAHAMEDK